MTKEYDELPRHERLACMSYAAHWLSLKPELTEGIKSDRELLERLDAFGKVLHEYLPKD